MLQWCGFVIVGAGCISFARQTGRKRGVMSSDNICLKREDPALTAAVSDMIAGLNTVAWHTKTVHWYRHVRRTCKRGEVPISEGIGFVQADWHVPSPASLTVWTGPLYVMPIGLYLPAHPEVFHTKGIQRLREVLIGRGLIGDAQIDRVLKVVVDALGPKQSFRLRYQTFSVKKLGIPLPLHHLFIHRV